MSKRLLKFFLILIIIFQSNYDVFAQSNGTMECKAWLYEKELGRLGRVKIIFEHPEFYVFKILATGPQGKDEWLEESKAKEIFARQRIVDEVLKLKENAKRCSSPIHQELINEYGENCSCFKEEKSYLYHLNVQIGELKEKLNTLISQKLKNVKKDQLDLSHQILELQKKSKGYIREKFKDIGKALDEISSKLNKMSEDS